MQHHLLKKSAHIPGFLTFHKELSKEIPVLAYDARLLLYEPLMAASNDRIVSKGRSKRGRVGFDRSGSARRKQGLAKQPQNEIL